MRLAAPDTGALYADEAMVSDFSLTDDSVILALLGAEEAPKPAA